ncbi:ABC transporter substrate-binding protein [Aestuariimicrobium soli]|uniref:ABC transporter substrate-binding protein n=1 Tax=Aestuariimicrobium soli TaxID=2035834 RepID=UPI003EB77042
MTRITVSRRHLLTGATAVAATSALAACTSPAGNTAATSGTKKLSLLLLGPTDAMASYFTKTALPAFTKASGYAVEMQTSDWGSAFQKITTGAASNSLPDVFVIGGIWTAPLAAKNALLDITDRLNGWDQKDQFFEGMVTDCEYDGKLYAVPAGADVRSGIYRKDLLDAAGVSALPTTWDEFRAAAQKIKDHGGVRSPIYWGLDKSIGVQQAFAQLFLQAGGEYFNADGKATFNSEAGKKALTFMASTFADGLSDINMVSSGNGPSFLAQGASAMTFSGAATIQNARDNAKDVVDKIVVGPALKPDAAGNATSVSWVNKLAIARTTKDADGAWKLLTHLTSKDQLNEIDNLWGTLPPRKDLADASWLTGELKTVMASADNTTSQPRSPKMMQLGPAVKDLLEPALRGSATVEDTLKAIDAKLDSLS